MESFCSFLKSYKKQFITYILVPIGIGLLSSIINGLSLTVLIDVVFYIAIFGLIFSGFFYVYEKGFFSLVSYSFKKVGTIFSRGRVEDLKDRERVDLKDYLNTRKHFFTMPLLHASIALIVFTFLLSFTFYV